MRCAFSEHKHSLSLTTSSLSCRRSTRFRCMANRDREPSLSVHRCVKPHDTLSSCSCDKTMTISRYRTMSLKRHVSTNEACFTQLFRVTCFSVSLLFAQLQLARSDLIEIPKFSEPITNVTAPVGREAILACVVQDLSAYKVAWLRVDTQTILTIASHVITKNHRIGVTHSDHRTWYLHIREVRESDRGWYMCQINTDPMKSQVGYLEVVVPPDILDYPTSTDMVVREGTNVTLRCAAIGSPQPNITWRREDGESISLGNGLEVMSIEGPVFNITRVNRLHMGAYLCIASNGVPPSVSKRISLIVHFPPMIWIQNQLVGAYEGQQLTLECHSEAYPKSINYWTRDKGEIVPQGGKYDPILLDNAYKVHMMLTIKSVGPSDYGSYKCVSKNSLGDTDGSIKLYPIPRSSNANKYPNGTDRKGKSRKHSTSSNNIIEDTEEGSLSNQRGLNLHQEFDDEDYSNSASYLVSCLVTAACCALLNVAIAA